ncbi:hypothetical protein EDB89DRAFT_2065650 [Lactarius sanguifluus]|nr:hypothetical protein EDB89DRAFT_2065650 [Lactarius sanguifluus]
MPSAWLMRETEETARGRLGGQSVSSRRSQRRAVDRTDELKRLNPSIFRPVITFNKDAKRAAQEAKVLQRYGEERERVIADNTRDSKSLGSGIDLRFPGGGNRGGAKWEASLQKEQRKYYRFEATASDDELEDEFDQEVFKNTEKLKRI